MARGKTSPPVLDPKDAEDNSLVAAAERIFGDDIKPEGEPTEVSVLNDWIPSDLTDMGGVSTSTFGQPSKEDMIRVKGGALYLGVRRRVVWMRGDVRPHPDWTIDTTAEKVIEGKFTKAGVEGGYARYRANVFDETGRLIASGTKTEYSECFLDFCEKAETGAIGRALAVAGYGTEAALDLDEGAESEHERLADAPVAGRPINITASTQTGLRVGGHSDYVTEAQLREIARLSRTLKLGITVSNLAEAVAERQMPAYSDEDAQAVLLDFLRSFTFEEAKTLISKLNLALSAKQKE